jgi:sulfite exporter TauE/SafE
MPAALRLQECEGSGLDGVGSLSVVALGIKFGVLPCGLVLTLLLRGNTPRGGSTNPQIP